MDFQFLIKNLLEGKQLYSLSERDLSDIFNIIKKSSFEDFNDFKYFHREFFASKKIKTENCEFVFSEKHVKNK